MRCMWEMQHLTEKESADLLVAASGKLTVLAQMLPRLIANGHRVLIFCQFKDVRTCKLLSDVQNAISFVAQPSTPHVEHNARPPPLTSFYMHYSKPANLMGTTQRTCRSRRTSEVHFEISPHARDWMQVMKVKAHL